MRAIVIDDEKAAINQLKAIGASSEDIEIIAGFTDPMKGLENIKTLQPQVVFLDISMPEISGLYLAEQIVKACPQTGIVFITSHDAYALEAFELNALDYLLKPLSQERFDKCIAKLLQYGYSSITSERLHHINHNFKEAAKKLFVEDNGDTVLLRPENIYYFEVRDKIVLIKTRNKEYASYNSLGNFEAKLQNSNFYRCHRSYLVNLDKVDRFINYSKKICEVGFSDIEETALVSKNSIGIMKKLLEY